MSTRRFETGLIFVDQAKTKYFNDLFAEIKATKAYWNLVRKATAPKKQTVIGPLKTGSSHLVVKDDDKACLMNTYFDSSGEKLGLDLRFQLLRYPHPGKCEVMLLSKAQLREVRCLPVISASLS